MITGPTTCICSLSATSGSSFRLTGYSKGSFTASGSSIKLTGYSEGSCTTSESSVKFTGYSEDSCTASGSCVKLTGYYEGSFYSGSAFWDVDPTEIESCSVFYCSLVIKSATLWALEGSYSGSHGSYSGSLSTMVIALFSDSVLLTSRCEMSFWSKFP